VHAEVSKSALITGITGQDGPYLAELLLSKGYQVFGLLRGQNNPQAPDLTRYLPQVTMISGDLLDMSSLMRAMAVAEPDEVYNLAAVSFVPFSWTNARLTTDVTGGGVLNMLEAVRLYQDCSGKQVRFYQASSAEMFGKVQEIPQRESTLLWPRSPYGVAKVYGHYMTINYRESYGMHASSGILFNHESPRRGVEFVTRKVTQAVARISLGLQDSVTLGNLESERDWGFAGDYVKAMYLMLQQDEAADYVIATGETHSIADLLDVAFSEVGIGDWTPYVKTDEQLERPAEVEVLIGDASKARSVLGWAPTVSFPELVAMMVRNDIDQQSQNIAGAGTHRATENPSRHDALRDRIGDRRDADRRRAGQANSSPMATLEQLPALVALRRIPVPIVAVGQDSTILFANGAFVAMLGYTHDALLSLKVQQLFHTLTVDESDAVSVVREHADLVVALVHRDGSIVRAKMSKSALLRGDDPVALVTFQDLTDQDP
jgi:GDPmannose 4,6-dehydratase